MFPRIFTRQFQTTSFRLAEETGTKLTKEQLRKRELRKMVQRRLQAKTPASDHPLYMSVSKALRYLRAIEVGQPASQQTITLTTLVVAERGVPPLTGNVSFGKPLKDVKVAVFTNDEAQAALMKDKYNVHLVGGSDLVSQIKAGEVNIDFDKAFATPDIVPQLASQVGRILGPRGLLPTAKKGTVAEDLEPLIKDSMSSVPFRQRGNSISLGVAKTHFTDKEVLENLLATQKAFKQSITNQQTKKPSILSQTTLTSTHGPGIVIDFA
ncbi:Mrpl1 [Kluyveromyces lactis]|nr:Mrpl1 [Kluyveromyces lactis]